LQKKSRLFLNKISCNYEDGTVSGYLGDINEPSMMMGSEIFKRSKEV
jgi:hypothetical protein